MSPVVTVRDSETLAQAANRMQENECKMGLVVDEQDRYLGVLSTGDLLEALFGPGLAELA